MALRRLALLVIVALLLQACATTRDAQVSEQERREYTSAVALQQANPEAARKALESFLREHPESGLADDAAEVLANIARDAGDYAAEQRWLRALIANQPQGSRSDSARVRLARIDYDAGNFDGARRTLNPLRFDELSRAQATAAYGLMADLSEDPVLRLRWLAKARRTAQDEEVLRRLDAEIDLQLASMTDADLERAERELGRGIPAGRLQLQRAARMLSLGDFEAAQELLSRASRMALSPSDELTLESLRQRIERGELAGDAIELPSFAELAEKPVPSVDGAVGSIGVILPLSGPFARYGEESLRGILLAARIFEERAFALPDSVGAASPTSGLSVSAADAPASQRVRIVIRDTAGDERRAARAVRELAADDSIVAIIGPLLSGPSEAAAAAAEEVGVPLLTLTSRESVAQDRPNVFRVRTTPADEVRFLVDYAIDTLKARRFAILHPENGYGRGMRDSFWSRVEQRGGGVVGVSGYDPKGTDFAKAIRRMIGYELLTSREKAALAEREQLLRRARRLDDKSAAVVREVAYSIPGPEGVPLPPRVDFDIVFIPDSHDKVVLLAPQLAFHEVRGVRLMGTDAWYHPDLLKIGGTYVRRAVIASPFHRESRFPFVARFVEAYETTYGSEPESMAAEAFDAANLVQVQLAKGWTTRDAVREGVNRTRGYPGASGVITVLPDGNARKRPFLLGVRRDRIVSLD